jgi:hypothetical protein
MNTKSIYMDLLDPAQTSPKFGDFIQCVGRTGKLNTKYLVLESRLVKRRSNTTTRRITMKVAIVGKEQEAISSNKTAKTFEMRWYKRARKNIRKLGAEI